MNQANKEEFIQVVLLARECDFDGREACKLHCEEYFDGLITAPQIDEVMKAAEERWPEYKEAIGFDRRSKNKIRTNQKQHPWKRKDRV